MATANGNQSTHPARHRRHLGYAVAGAQRARDEIQQLREASARAKAESEDIARAVKRAQDAALLQRSEDASPRGWQTGTPADVCQQPGCGEHASWFVRFQRDGGRSAFRRLCTRDAARRVRRRAHITTRGEAQ